MAERVDFYILKKKQTEAYFYLARLVEKIYSLDKTVIIWTVDANESHYLDDFLWQYRDDSFLPHDIFERENTVSSPILISDKCIVAQDILINLTGTAPQNSSDFSRIIELVYEDENLIIQSRQKYRHYQSIGCQLHTTHIKENH